MAVKARLEVPATLHGNSDSTARLIYQCIKDGTTNDAFKDLDWADLRREHSFTTTGVEYYTMPPDFDRIISGTIWDRTNDRQLAGPVSAEKWHAWFSGMSGLTGLTRLCRIYGPDLNSSTYSSRKRLRIYPDDPNSTGVPNTAADPIEVAYEYISDRYVVNVASNLVKYTSEWTSDNDYCVLDDDVVEAAAVYRVLRAMGMSFSDEEAEYNALIEERGSRNAGAETLSMNQTGIVFATNTPETGYGS